MNPRAQGTIEYLVIIAVVVVIALVVVGLMMGFLNPSSAVAENATHIGAFTAAIANTGSGGGGGSGGNGDGRPGGSGIVIVRYLTD